MTNYRPPISIRQGAVIVCLSGLALIAADQATSWWAKSALSPGQIVPVVQPWLGLTDSIGLPFEIGGSALVFFVLIGVVMLGLFALIAAGGVGRPLHGVAVGFLLGTLTSSLFDYLRNGSVENYIRIEPGPHTVFKANLALVAVAFSTAVLMLAAFAGSFPAFWQRRRSTAGH